MSHGYRPKGRSAYVRARLAEILGQRQQWRRALREIADILAP